MKTLIDEIIHSIGEGYDENLDFLLDPNKSVLMYKHIKSTLTYLPKKYAIRVKDEYFPRLFTNFTEALDFAEKMNEDNLTDTKERIFVHFNRFELFEIEEI